MKPRVAVFDFAGCEGCELQFANLEDQVSRLVDAVDIVSFREIMKEQSDEYDIAFVEGAIQRPGDEERVKDIRAKARVLVALGTCACTGGVNKLRNDWSILEAKAEVYGGAPLGRKRLFDVRRARALDEVVPVDFSIRGCPVRKEQVLYYIERLAWMPLHPPADSVFHVVDAPTPIDERSLVCFNPGKCILCRRCDVMCREALGVDALGVVGKGPETAIATPRDVGFDRNGCIRCGQCVSTCPCGALEARSTLAKLVAELRAGRALDIAIDSIALASLVARADSLKTMPPSEAERQVIGALKAAGLRQVLQYDHYVMASLGHDARMTPPGTPRMRSWCKGAFNYAQARIDEQQVARSEECAPWTLLLEHAAGRPMCLVTPCTALKGVDGFAHVLSAMELDELLAQCEVDLERTSPRDYDGPVAPGGKTRPGGGPVRLPVGVPVRSARIAKHLPAQLPEIREGPVDLFPCLDRCLTGGGNYPTVERAVIDGRRRWLEALWGVRP